MAKSKAVYTVIITDQAAELLKSHGLALLLHESDKGARSFKCTAIDQNGPYLKMQVFIEAVDLTVDFQIPHHYVLYIFGEHDKKLGF